MVKQPLSKNKEARKLVSEMVKVIRQEPGEEGLCYKGDASHTYSVLVGKLAMTTNPRVGRPTTYAERRAISWVLRNMPDGESSPREFLEWIA